MDPEARRLVDLGIPTIVAVAVAVADLDDAAVAAAFDQRKEQRIRRGP